MAMHPGHRISTSRLMKTCLALGPAGSPTGGGKTCSGGTFGAGRRILPAGSARRRSHCQQQFNVQASLSGTNLGRLHLIWCSNGVITRTDSTAEEDAFLPSALSADAAHVLPGTHPPNLLSQWSHSKLAAHTQLIRRLPVEPWPKLIDRGR